MSIADSDIWYWAGAIAAERSLNVEISEPDVSPMALQGTKAEDVVAHVCGDWVRGLKYFWFKDAEIDDDTNPFEVRLGKHVDLDVPDDVVGIRALRKVKAEGIKRHELGVVLEGDKPALLGFRLEDISYKGNVIGKMTNCVWSPRMKANIGFALISSSVAAGETVTILRAAGPTEAKLVELPFL